MIFITISAIYFIIPIIFLVVDAKAKNKIANSDTFVYPKFYKIIGIIGFPIIVLANIFLVNNYESKYVVLVIFYFLFFIAVFWFMLQVLSWKLILKDNQIIYRNLFGFIKHFNYEDIVKIIPIYKRKSNIVVKYKMYVKKSKIVIEGIIEGFNSFPKILKGKLKKHNITISFTEKPT